MRLALMVAALVAAAVMVPLSAEAKKAQKISCAQAKKVLKAKGYQVLSADGCRGRYYQISTVKGEAVLVKFDSRTGKWIDIFGGD